MADEYAKNLGESNYADPNNLAEIEEIRSEKLNEGYEKTNAPHDILGKLIIIGDQGKH